MFRFGTALEIIYPQPLAGDSNIEVVVVAAVTTGSAMALAVTMAAATAGAADDGLTSSWPRTQSV